MSKINLLILVTILVLSFMYMFTVNSLGTKGYEIKKIDAQLHTLQTEQNNLQIQASDLQSIDKIQSNASKLNFVQTASVNYLKSSDYALK